MKQGRWVGGGWSRNNFRLFTDSTTRSRRNLIRFPGVPAGSSGVLIGAGRNALEVFGVVPHKDLIRAENASALRVADTSPAGGEKEGEMVVESSAAEREEDKRRVAMNSSF
ncbi:hypothetical protein B296_00009292 [Ensete ventricosum]|uniref:Uncharacterized protein n=1 Tax=Ensete ventricosum TaxID=4639 RepID=A0A427BAJ9_ENSVE|nr:hypothetical protein B296_00009292 [Ensete ventricosum]